MTPSGEFHKALKTWSQIKHQILGGYLSLLLGKVARPATQTQGEVFLHCVDGFAGQGRYGDNEKGSPLIAAEISDNPIQPSRKGLLRCINVEAKQATFANLQDATQAYVSKGLVTNLFGTFEEHLDDILQRIGRDPAFFFVDPFGTASTDFSTLERLASRAGKTEALIRYDDTRVKRLISWAGNNLDRLESRAKRTAEKFAMKVRELTSNEAILSFLNSEPDSRERLIEGYIAEVKRRGIFRHGIYYPIRNPQTGGHRYFLVHFCNFPDGYFYMANFMARAERSVSTPRESLRQPRQVQGDLFGGGNEPPQAYALCEQLEILGINNQLADAAEQGRIDAIARALPGLLREANLSGHTVENRILYTLIVDRFGYAHTRQEWERALKQLHRDRVLALEDGVKDGGTTRVSNSIALSTFD